MNVNGAALGAAFGSFLGGPIGSAVGAVVGTFTEEYLRENGLPSTGTRRVRTVTVKPRDVKVQTEQEIVVEEKPDPAKYNICESCGTANSKTRLLCEYCGERMPVKTD